MENITTPGLVVYKKLLNESSKLLSVDYYLPKLGEVGSKYVISNLKMFVELGDNNEREATKRLEFNGDNSDSGRSKIGKLLWKTGNRKRKATESGNDEAKRIITRSGNISGNQLPELNNDFYIYVASAYKLNKIYYNRCGSRIENDTGLNTYLKMKFMNSFQMGGNEIDNNYHILNTFENIDTSTLINDETKDLLEDVELILFTSFVEMNTNFSDNNNLCYFGNDENYKRLGESAINNVCSSINDEDIQDGSLKRQLILPEFANIVAASFSNWINNESMLNLIKRTALFIPADKFDSKFVVVKYECDSSEVNNNNNDALSDLVKYWAMSRKFKLVVQRNDENYNLSFVKEITEHGSIMNLGAKIIKYIMSQGTIYLYTNSNLKTEAVNQDLNKRVLLLNNKYMLNLLTFIYNYSFDDLNIENSTTQQSFIPILENYNHSALSTQENPTSVGQIEQVNLENKSFAVFKCVTDLNDDDDVRLFNFVLYFGKIWPNDVGFKILLKFYDNIYYDLEIDKFPDKIQLVNQLKSEIETINQMNETFRDELMMSRELMSTGLSIDNHFNANNSLDIEYFSTTYVLEFSNVYCYNEGGDNGPNVNMQTSRLNDYSENNKLKVTVLKSPGADNTENVISLKETNTILNLNGNEIVFKKDATTFTTFMTFESKQNAYNIKYTVRVEDSDMAKISTHCEDDNNYNNESTRVVDLVKSILEYNKQ